MADEDVVIRRRLLTRTSTLGKTGLKKCAEGLLTLLDDLADESVDAGACKQGMDALFWELEQLEFEANKTDILSFTSQRELEAYEALNADIDASIAKVASEIEELKTTVREEKTVRAYKEEYESIARVVNELPSRKDIAAEAAVEEKRSSDVVETIKAVDTKLELRTKQFALLLSTIQNLKATLDEDEDEEREQQRTLAEDADDEDMEDGLVSAAPKSPLGRRVHDSGAGDDGDAPPSRPSSP